MAKREQKEPRGPLDPPSRKYIPPFEALRAFDAVARLGGIRKAAFSLQRDHAVVGRHLRALEGWVGQRLVERNSKGITLTEYGETYHAQIAQAMDMIAAATIEQMRRGESSRITIRCAPGFAFYWLSRRLPEFEARHPDCQIELHPADRNAGWLPKEADVDIRFVSDYAPVLKVPSDLRSLCIGKVPIIAVASPEYMASHPPVIEPQDLLGFRLLHEQDFDSWANWLAVHGVHSDIDLKGPRLWQGHLTLDAAMRGQGVALINVLVAADDLASGRLLEIGGGLKSFKPYAFGEYYLISHADRWDSLVIRKFRHWLTKTISSDSDMINRTYLNHSEIV